MGKVVEMRRRYGGNKLPYDAEVEYLESRGTAAYINTGYIPQGLDIRIACKLYYGGYYKEFSWPAIVYTYVNDATRCYRLMMRNKSHTLVVQNARRGNSSSDNNYALTVGNVYEVDFDHYNYTINGVTYTHVDYGTTVENTSTLSFGNISTALNLRFYYFKLWKGDNLILDMIPVRVGTTGYMYDKVTCQLFSNSGTEEFSLGPDV